MATVDSRHFGFSGKTYVVRFNVVADDTLLPGWRDDRCDSHRPVSPGQIGFGGIMFRILASQTDFPNPQSPMPSGQTSSGKPDRATCAGRTAVFRTENPIVPEKRETFRHSNIAKNQ
jgi:hypothetical protein